MRSCCFLDRDGVVNVEVSYLSDPDQAELIPGVPEAIAALHRAGFLVIVVTNQSGVARNMYSMEDVHRVHARLQAKLLAFGSDCTIDAFYCCPHHPDHTGPCRCRKPAPGMLLEAAAQWQLDLHSAVMAGDRLSDLHAGQEAGCRESVLLKTGYGSRLTQEAAAEGFPVAEDLPDAVKRWIP